MYPLSLLYCSCRNWTLLCTFYIQSRLLVLPHYWFGEMLSHCMSAAWLCTKKPTILIAVSQSILQFKNLMCKFAQFGCSTYKTLIAIIWGVFTICTWTYCSQMGFIGRETCSVSHRFVDRQSKVTTGNKDATIFAYIFLGTPLVPLSIWNLKMVDTQKLHFKM